MHIGITQPHTVPDTARPDTSFAFTVPRAEPAPATPQAEPAWQGITAGWLAGGDLAG